MARTRYTEQDDAFLRQHYQKRGARFCAEHLPGHSELSIITRAQRIGAARLMEDLRRPSNEIIDATIRRAYTGERSHGFVTRCAKSVGRSRAWVSKRALELGLIQVRDRRVWSEDELAFAARHPLMSPVYLSKSMRRRGWKRTPAAIAFQRKIGRISRDQEGIFTAADLAETMGVVTGVVTGWIKNGLLKADRRGTARSEAQKGDGYVIHERDVARFVLCHPAHFSLTKLEPNKVWFLDLMARYARTVSATGRQDGSRRAAA